MLLSLPSLVHPYVDLDMPAGFPSSIFSRAYHTHLSQHSNDFDPLTSSFSSSPTPPSTLPQFHPLLVRPADHPQQQVAARGNGGNSATNSGGRPNSNAAALSFENITPSAEAAVQAMQQALTNISQEAGGGRGNATGGSSSEATRG